ncbi:MAG: phosphate ABC transporter ATP-binding protein PstB [Armatimonadota bacterium]|nr:phosphate ABC transporter ATP-binding protein PstB [Armatimonadota bacterium]
MDEAGTTLVKPFEPGAGPNPNHSTLVQPGHEIAISVRDLRLWYGKSQALKSINLEIPVREVTALIGPSGCGKSTFLRCLNRMNDEIENVRIEGAIEFEGKDICGPAVNMISLRRRVGMVFQRPNPFPMSIFDNVAYGPKIHGNRNRVQLQELVERSLQGAALWDEVKDKLKTSALGLSGGQQQRLCIARLLAVEPEVLLMDEPCSALDPLSTFKVEELMLQLKEKYTIVLVTHNMYQASRVSRFTGFFLTGELVEFGDTESLFEKPVDKRTDDYVRGRFG